MTLPAAAHFSAIAIWIFAALLQLSASLSVVECATAVLGVLPAPPPIRRRLPARSTKETNRGGGKALKRAGSEASLQTGRVLRPPGVESTRIGPDGPDGVITGNIHADVLRRHH